MSVSNTESLKLVTADELAELLGMSRQSIYRRVRRGELPCVRTGARQIRFDLAAVERWVGARSSFQPKGQR